MKKYIITSLLICLTINSSALSKSSTENTSAQNHSFEFNWATVPDYMDVNTRIFNLQKEISAAFNDKRLTSDQTENLKSSLKEVIDMKETFLSDGKLTVWERVRLILELDKISQGLELRLAKRKTAITDISGKELQLQKEIAEAFISGRLTNRDSAVLTRQLEEIRKKERLFRSDKKFSQSEMISLSYDLDKLNFELERSVKARFIGNPSIESRLTGLRRWMDNLSKENQLSSSQVNEIDQLLKKASTQYSAMKNPKDKNPEAILNLALKLDEITTKLRNYAPNLVSADKKLNSLQTEIQSKLSELKTSNKSDLQTLDALTQEYNRIETLESLFKSDNELSEGEVETLSREFTTLLKRIELLSEQKSIVKEAFDNELLSVQSRFAKLKSAGILTDSSAISLSIKQLEDTYLAYKSDDKSSGTDLRVMSDNLESIKRKLNSMINEVPDTKERKLEIERKLALAIASKRMSRAISETIRSEYNQISFSELRMRRGKEISDDDQIKLNSDYQKIDKKIDSYLPKAVDIEKLFESLDGKMKRLKEKAPAATINNFKEDYERVKSIESSFRSSDDRLTDWEICALSNELLKLNKEVSKVLGDK